MNPLTRGRRRCPHTASCTRWSLPAGVDRVWEMLNDGSTYGEWWPCIVGYQSLTPGVTGVGSRAERLVPRALPFCEKVVFDPAL